MEKPKKSEASKITKGKLAYDLLVTACVGLFLFAFFDKALFPSHATITFTHEDTQVTTTITKTFWMIYANSEVTPLSTADNYTNGFCVSECRFNEPATSLEIHYNHGEVEVEDSEYWTITIDYHQ